MMVSFQSKSGPDDPEPEEDMSGYCVAGATACIREWNYMPISTPWKVVVIAGLWAVAFISYRTARRRERELTERPSRNNALYLPKPNKDAN